MVKPLSLKILRLAGRCNNGANRTSGNLYHLVPSDSLKAVCGAKPGKRSAGWYTWGDEEIDEPTCPRCVKARDGWAQP